MAEQRKVVQELKQDDILIIYSADKGKAVEVNRRIWLRWLIRYNGGEAHKGTQEEFPGSVC